VILMSDDVIFPEDREEQDQSKQDSSEPDKDLLDNPVFWIKDEEKGLEITGWINDYTDSDEKLQYYISLTAEKGGSRQRMALFPKKKFRPYLREAVEKYKEEQGDQK